jgi:hypothetical protein
MKEGRVRDSRCSAARSRRLAMRIGHSVCLVLVCALMLAGSAAPALAVTQPLVAPAASLRTAVWIGVAPTSVRYGQPVTVNATLVNSAGTRVPGRTVSVEQCTRAGVWTTVKSASSSTGRYTFVVYPSRRTYYRVSFAGDATYYSSRSAYQLVSTTAQLTGPVTSAAGVIKGKAITVSGYLKPRHTAGTSAVTLQAWMLVSGTWKLIGTYPAPIANYSTYSRYGATVYLPYAGSWKIRAVHADADHLWTGTGWAWVRVYPVTVAVPSFARLGGLSSLSVDGSVYYGGIYYGDTRYLANYRRIASSVGLKVEFYVMPASADVFQHGYGGWPNDQNPEPGTVVPGGSTVIMTVIQE